MQLIQIGEQETVPPVNVTILQMFQQLAQREADMIRECKARIDARNGSAARRSNA